MIGSSRKQDTRNELRQNLSVLTFKFFYIMADDLNLRWRTILSLHNTYPSGNNTVSFWHQEDIYVSFTLHISEFVCCVQWEYVIISKVKCSESNTSFPKKRPFFKHANTVMMLL